MNKDEHFSGKSIFVVSENAIVKVPMKFVHSVLKIRAVNVPCKNTVSIL